MSKSEELSIVKLCHSTSSSMAIMEFEGLGKEYYDDDSDKEIDLPIDPIWEAQQISTFTAWCNAHLRKANLKIDNFERDFRSGLKLMKLLEIISNDSLPPPDKGRMRFHKIANVNKALKFIEERGVKLASIGAEEIVDGNVKMTLGMIWTIILRFTIQDILVEESSAKEGLLLWCKRRTTEYENVNIENFKNSFQDGLAFCALIDSHDKSLLNYKSLSPSHSSHNLKLAFSVAEKHLDVPQMLNIDDMIQNKDSDERSIMTYVSSYYHAIERKEKLDAALKNICKIITQEMEENQHAMDSDILSKNILNWIEHWINEFQNRLQFDDQSTLNSKLSDFKKYKFIDKPQKNKDKIQVQYLNLKKSSEKKKHNNFSIIQSKWCEMEKLESHYEEHISEQKYRCDLIQNFLNSFEINFQVQRAWISNKIDLLVSKDYETANISDLKKLQRTAETFASNVGSHKARNDKIINIAAELRRLNYKDMDTIEKKVNIILNPWETLNHLNSQRTEKINSFVHALTEIDDLQLEFAKRVMPLYNWIQQAIQDLNDRFTFHFIEDIKDLIKAQEIFKSTVDEATDELTYVKSLSDRIGRIVTITGIQKIPLNPYSDILLQDVQKSWIQLERSIPERDKILKDALLKQISLKDCKDNFTKISKKVAEELLEIQKNIFDLISLNITKKQSKCQTLLGRMNKCSSQLKELEVLNQKMDENYKIDNSKSHYSYEQLSAMFEILEYLLTEMYSSSNFQLTSNQSDTSFNNKIEEYKSCFKYFDRSNSNQLDSKQFRSCMVSLGYSLDENENNDKQFKDIMMIVDPENTGFVSLNSFMDFITRKNVNQGINEQLTESFKILANNLNTISRSTIIQELPEPIAKYCIENMPVKISSNGDNECYLDYNIFSSRIFNSSSIQEINGSA